MNIFTHIKWVNVSVAPHEDTGWQLVWEAATCAVGACLSRYVCLSLSVSGLSVVRLGLAGHTETHPPCHDVNNAVFPRLHSQHRERLPPTPFAQSYTRYQLLSMFNYITSKPQHSRARKTPL